MPPQDRRKEMTKIVAKLAEEGKVAIRCGWLAAACIVGLS